MSARFLTLLAAASTASAAGFAGIQVAAIGNVLAVTSAPAANGASACATDVSVISYCATAIPNFSNAPDSVLAPCICCNGGSPISASYSACANYLSGVSSYSSQSVGFSQLYGACSVYGAGVCSASATASGSTRPTGSMTTSRSSGATSTTRTGSSSTGSAPSRATTPAACSSLFSVISHCATSGYTTQKDSQIASCLCYQSGVYTTAFDDYAAGCAPWAKTYDTADYTNMLALTEFCESYPASTTTSSSTSTTSSTTTTTTSSGGQGGQNAGSPSTTSTSRALAASPMVAGGIVAWTAGWLTFVLSFFFLI